MNVQRYLGDGAYAESHGWALRVFTSNGITEDRGVFLGPSELAALIVFAREEGIIP